MSEDQHNGADGESGAGREKRRYDSSRRRAQAGATREQILEAARRLFIARGYAGATMEAIAREAGVAVETVYAAFKSKRTVLARLVDLLVMGDTARGSLLERSGPQRVRAETDQRRQIALFAHDMAAIMGRMGPLFAVIRGAAISEPEIATLLQRLLAARFSNLHAFVRWVERNGPLRAGLATDEAAETVWTVSSAEIHQLLTVDRGWEPEHYERWLRDTLCLLLLEPERE